MTRPILGIDPGAAAGAYATITTANAVIALDDLPTSASATARGQRSELDIHALANLVRTLAPAHSQHRADALLIALYGAQHDQSRAVVGARGSGEAA
jgi:hypothetical protein